MDDQVAVDEPVTAEQEPIRDTETATPVADDRGSRLLRRQRLAIVVMAICLVVSIGGLVASTLIKSPMQAAAETEPPVPTVLTETVERRVLVSTVVTRGTVVAAAQVTVSPPTPEGTKPVVTRVPLAAGKQVRAGDVVIEVSGRPVVALPGVLSTYRDLKPGDDGKDVAQLQRALAKLGLYSDGDDDGHFGAATKSAVRRLYARTGYDVPDTGGPGGTADRAAVQTAQSGVDAAQRAVDAMKRRIAAAGSAAPAPDEEPLAVQLAYLKKALKAAKAGLADLVAHSGPMVPAAEVVFLPAFPARIAQLSAKLGAQAPNPLLSLSAGALTVRAKPRPDQAKLLKPGMPVEIVAESVGSHKGTVTSVGTVTSDVQETGATQETAGGAEPAAAIAEGPPYVPVVVTPSAPLPAGWSYQDVRLTFSSAQTRGPVLVVPLSAVSSGADGRTTVSKMLPDSKIVRIDVRAGVSGDGFVEVTPTSAADTLEQGDQVVVGQ
jgi:peptidoglycan hydrolase-like protein with peptidoglycan-binding domain